MRVFSLNSIWNTQKGFSNLDEFFWPRRWSLKNGATIFICFSCFLFWWRRRLRECLVRYEQSDQIGRFLKVLGDKFSYKRSPNVCWLVGLFWKHTFSLINWCSYFLGNFWKFLGYFIFQRLVTLGMRLKQIVCQQRFVWCPGLFERDSSQSYIK